MSLAKVENMGALQLFTLGGSGGMFPRKILVILGVLRCTLVHSKAYLKHTELLVKGLIIIVSLSLLAELVAPPPAPMLSTALTAGYKLQYMKLLVCLS